MTHAHRSACPRVCVQAEYTMSTDEFWSAVRSCFGGGCVVVFLIFVVRMRNWQLRNTRLLSVVAQYSQTIASVNWKALVSTQACATPPLGRLNRSSPG